MVKALLLVGMLLGQAEPAPSGEELAVQVRRLVRQLDAPQLKVRDQAEEELLKLGAGVLPLLPAEIDPSKAEVAQRVARVRQKLQRTAAEASMEPSTVTLQGTMPLSQALAAIQEQTGNKIADKRREAVANAPDPAVKVDFNKTPFWSALDRVLDQAGLSVYPFGSERAIHVVAQPGEEGSRTRRAVYAGPFRFEPVGIQAVRDLRNPQNESLRLEVEVAWEPRVQPITLMLPMEEIKAVDESGKPIAVASQGAELEIPIGEGQIAKQVFLPLDLPPRDAKQIARLQGSLRALSPGKIDTFRFTDLDKAKNVSKRVAGATVTLNDAIKNNKLWEVFMTLQFDDAQGALASHRTWVYNNPAWLEGPDEKKIQPVATDPSRRTENVVGLGYLFPVENLAGHSFVYQTPTVILSVSVPFEFKEIPLP